MKTPSKWLCSLILLALLGSSGCLNSWYAKRRAVKHFASALALHDAEFDEDALVQLREAVRLDTDFNLAHSMLGDLYRQQGDYQRAALAYESACRLDPYAFADHLNLGQVYKALKRFQDAINILRRACQLSPNSPDAHFNLGICYYQTENYDLAAAFCSRAADLDPGNKTILGGLGDIYGRTGDDYHAIKAYKQALELDPDQYDIMIRLGMVYLRMERYTPAQFILEKAIAAAPEKTEPHIALGYCLLCQRKIELARTCYTQAFRLDSKCAAAQNGIGVASMMAYVDDPAKDIENCRQAVESWHASLEINPDQPKIKKLLAKYQHLPRQQAQAIAANETHPTPETTASAGPPAN